MIKETDLPVEVSVFDSVELAYPQEISGSFDALKRNLPVLIECDKELAPYLYKCLRDRIKEEGKRCIYLDGRASGNEGAMPAGMMSTMISQLRDAVRGSVEEILIVMPHLDLLTTSSGGLSTEAREVVALMYENPNVLWLAFKDHSFSLPQVIEDLFSHRESIVGIPRDRLRHLVTQRESRKFGREFDIFMLYKYVSGINSVRLRHLLSSIVGEDYPQDTKPAYDQLRNATLVGKLTIPDIDLDKDIGGYKIVKERLQNEILSILAKKDQETDVNVIQRMESLIPRGMIFWGPPGTGKTLFAKAMATELGAAVIVVSGPELKSRWVGESEQRIRQIFTQARACAPSIIIFDELDSFATARGTYTGSGAEHSMVNQLLTEMDGFRDNEMVFIVGTTNFVESLDQALLRPGRFEFHLKIPYPRSEDRRAIFEIYNKNLDLDMNEAALDYVVKRTADFVEGTNMPYTGDHIQALCRAIARRRIREQLSGQTTIDDIETSMTEYLNRPELTAAEEKIVATHECGHAICSLHCEHSPQIDRISIQGDLAGSLGFVAYADPAHRYVTTRGALLDSICTLFGGREAEKLFLDDMSIGSARDLEMATSIARALVEEFGMGPEEIDKRSYIQDNKDAPGLSDDTREKLEQAIQNILKEQCQRAKDIISDHKDELMILRDLLLEKKIIDGNTFRDALVRTDKKDQQQSPRQKENA